jgi:iron complex transport system ATP-binding protein
MIRVEQLCVTRGRRNVLTDIDLAVNPGECVAIVGPNGAGKTSLLQAILGLLPERTGRITIRDKLLRRWSRRALAREIVYVAQDHEGYLGFLVRDVLDAARYAYVSAVARAGEQDQAAVERAIEQCGIGHLLDRTLDALSAGERQKVWLAAAVAQGSPTMLLDEPTTALDPKHQVELVRLMRELLAAGRTMLIVSHDLNLPAWMGGRVVALREGRKILDGPAEDFLDADRLRGIFQTDFELMAQAEGRLPAVHVRV